MIELTRLEREVVFSHFEKMMPKLHIRAEHCVFCIEPREYKKEGNVVILFNNVLFSLQKEQKILVFFFHKKVKICFKTILKNEKTKHFEIPDSVYIKNRKKNKRTPFPSLSLYSQNLLLSTFLSANISYSFKTEEIKEREKLKKIFTLSNQMGHDLLYLLTEMKRFSPKEENLYSQLMIINNFLVKKEKGKLEKKSLYLFSDSNIILLFANIKFARQFASNKNKIFQAKISFENRNITCNVCYCFFSPFFKEGREDVEGFLGLRIDSIQEEDRRYLYEGVFAHHYGKVK